MWQNGGRKKTSPALEGKKNPTKSILKPIIQRARENPGWADRKLGRLPSLILFSFSAYSFELADVYHEELKLRTNKSGEQEEEGKIFPTLQYTHAASKLSDEER